MHITNYFCFSVSSSARTQSSFANAQKAYADLDPAFHFDADPDPGPTFTLMQLQIRQSAISILKTLQGSTPL